MKKIHRFLVAAIPASDAFSITEQALVRQIASVLQLRRAESIILFTDGGSDEIVEIESIEKDRIEVRKKETIPATPWPRQLTAAVAIPKGATLELIVQKLTEIGVAKIVPIISARTVKSGVRLSRLQTISDEALEQSGGSARVALCEPMTLKSAVAALPGTAVVFEKGAAPAAAFSSGDQEIIMYIGPEGGWSAEDLALFKERGAQFLSLGARTLRSETAAIIGAYTLLWNH